MELDECQQTDSTMSDTVQCSYRRNEIVLQILAESDYKHVLY